MNDQAALTELRMIRRLLAAQLFHTLDQGSATQKEKTRVLSKAGLTPAEIADLFGVTPNSVSVTLVALRKEGALPAVTSKRGATEKELANATAE